MTVGRPQTDGDLLADILRRLADLERSAQAGHTSIGAGGLRVLDGGEVRIEGGQLVVTDVDGNEIVVQDSGGLTVKTAAGLTVATITAAGIEVTANGYVQSADFVADTSGWRIKSGEAEFNVLKVGSELIPPDALLLSLAGDGASATGFTINTTSSAKASVSIPVPSWATEALVLATANASITNPGAGSFDYGYIRAFINGVGGGEQFSGYDAGEFENISSSAQRLITSGLGSNITVDVRLRTQSNDWGSNAGNIANIDTIIVFRG